MFKPNDSLLEGNLGEKLVVPGLKSKFSPEEIKEMVNLIQNYTGKDINHILSLSSNFGYAIDFLKGDTKKYGKLLALIGDLTKSNENPKLLFQLVGFIKKGSDDILPKLKGILESDKKQNEDLGGTGLTARGKIIEETIRLIEEKQVKNGVI